MDRKNKEKISLFLNFAIVILEIIAFVLRAQQQSVKMFIFYTQLSNLFALLSSALIVICYFINIKKEIKIPKFAIIVKYVSTCCLTLTFVISLFVLAPFPQSGGYMKMMFQGALFFHHLFCPLLALISLVAFENYFYLSKKWCWIALLPSLIYGIILLIFNIFNVLEGPYPFLMTDIQPIYLIVVWFMLIAIFEYSFCLLIKYFFNRGKPLNNDVYNYN